MNCPQCEAVTGPDSAFCASCGARLAPAGVSNGTAGQFAATGTQLGADPAATSAGYGAAGGSEDQAPGYSQGSYPQGAPGPNPQRPPSSGPPPVNFDLNRLTTVDKIVAGATLITMFSIWLPWYVVSLGGEDFESGGSVSFSGTWGHGWLWIEFLLALVLLAYLAARAAWEELPVSIPVGHAPLLVVATALQFLLILIAFADIPYGGQGMGLNWAAFMGLFAALAAAGPVVYPAVKSYLDSRKAPGPGAY